MFAAADRPGAQSLVILPRGYPPPARPPGELLFASHPEPDASSIAAARAALRFFSRFGPDDLIVCLVSGGASSLLCLPRSGVTLESKRSAVRRLVRRGASIRELNRLRTALSAVKGGRLGRTTGARLVNLVLSDVAGDRPSLVGSGPTIRGRRGDLTRVVASNRTGLQAAARQAARSGATVVVRRQTLAGEASEAGRLFARAARAADGGYVLAGGETTVTLRGVRGRGGRSLEFALGAAVELDGEEGVVMLAAGSDGRDGTSDAAGAFVDGSTLARARRMRLDALETLARHDAHRFFERLGDLFRSGPTGTNVCDWAFARIARASGRPASGRRL
jgi:glycerate-2-kinase